MTSTTFAFRLVVRGNTADGVRVRRVRSIVSTSYEQAWADFGEEHYLDMSDGLTGLSFSVLPPVGWRIDGAVSKGFEAA